MNTGKVSVIIPTYNAQAYVHALLEDIVKQTYRNLEIIIVDDGSTDHTLDILHRFAQKDVRIQIIEQANAGPSHARNIGLTRATGEFVRFVDADDRVPKNSIAWMLGPFAKYQNLDLVIGNFKVHGANNYYLGNQTISGFCKADAFTDLVLSHFQTCYIGVVWNKLYRREILLQKQIWFDEKLYWSEDFLFNMKYFLYSRNYFILKKQGGIYTYRIQKEGITANLWSTYADQIPQIEHQKYETLWAYAKRYGKNRRFELEYEYSRLYDRLSLITKQRKLGLRVCYTEFVSLLQQDGILAYLQLKRRQNLVWSMLYEATRKKRYKGVFLFFWTKGWIGVIVRFRWRFLFRQGIR